MNQPETLAEEIAVAYRNHAHRREIVAIIEKYLPEDVKTGFMCQVAFEYELGNDLFGTEIYPSIEAVPPHEGCGIVKVEVRLAEIVKPECYTWEGGIPAEVVKKME